MIERDLFGRVVLVRHWGRISTHGCEMVEEFACEIEAGQTLEAVAQAKRRRYRDLWGHSWSGLHAKKNPAQRPGSSHQKDCHRDQHVG
jgi:hypothetical protein